MLLHAVTVAVVGISLLVRLEPSRMCGHAVARPGRCAPLHLAKMFKYVSDARESRDKKLAMRCTFCADRVFELFALVFLVTRMAMYPVWLERARRGDALLPERFAGMDLRGFIVDLLVQATGSI